MFVSSIKKKLLITRKVQVYINNGRILFVLVTLRIIEKLECTPKIQIQSHNIALGV